MNHKVITFQKYADIHPNDTEMKLIVTGGLESRNIEPIKTCCHQDKSLHPMLNIIKHKGKRVSALRCARYGNLGIHKIIGGEEEGILRAPPEKEGIYAFIWYFTSDRLLTGKPWSVEEIKQTRPYKKFSVYGEIWLHIPDGCSYPFLDVFYEDGDFEIDKWKLIHTKDIGHILKYISNPHFYGYDWEHLEVFVTKRAKILSF